MYKLSPLYLTLATAFTSASVAISAAEQTNDIAEDLEVMIVTSKIVKPLKDVSGSVSVINADDIEHQAITDMSQLFKYDPSIQVTGSTGGAQNIVVRGMGSDRILIIKDGMRVNEGYGANGANDIVGRGFIDVGTVKQVEVAKGAASSLYGSDALGGIAVFVTKDASDYLADGESFAGKIKAAYTDSGEQANVSGTLAFKTGNFEHLITLTERQGHEVQNFQETRPDLDIESTGAMYKAKYNLSEKSSVNLMADWWQQDTEGKLANALLGPFRTLADYGYQIVDEYSTSDKENTSIKLSYHSENNTSFYDVLNVAVYVNDTQQTDVEYGYLDINAPMFGTVEKRDMWETGVFEQKTIGFISNASLKLNQQHTFGYGLDIEHSEASRTSEKLYSVAGTPKPGYPLLDDKFPTTDVKRMGLFINDELTLSEKTTMTLGARYDRYDMDANGAIKADGEAYRDFDDSNLSLNAGLLYRINERLNAFVQYGEGFKVPSYDLAYIDHDNSLYGYKLLPSDDLSPEESQTFEIGVKGHIGNLAMTFAMFRNEFDNFLATQLIGTEPALDPFTGAETQILLFQYQNIDAVTIDGTELGLTYYFDDSVSLFANAAYQDGKDDTTGEYISSISPISGTAGINISGDNWSSDFIVNWARAMNKVNEGDADTSGYAVFDWILDYSFNDAVKASVVVNNILDKEYIRYNNIAGHAIDADLDYFTAQGRNMRVNVSYSF